MVYQYELIEYKKELPMKLFCQRIGNVQRHWHSSLELLLVLSGSMNAIIENSSYMLEEDDIILINPNQIHETHSEDCVLIALQLRLSMFTPLGLTEDQIAFHCNSAGDPNKENFLPLKQIIAKLVQIGDTPLPNKELLNYQYVYQLMYELVTRFQTVPSKIPRRSRKQMERLRELLDYIGTHYPEDLTLSGLASRFYLSPTYLSSFFLKHMGISLTEYTAKVRNEHAVHALLHTQDTIEEIAAKCGYASPRSFATLFRRHFSMLPSQFRKNFQDADRSSLSAGNASDSYLELETFDYGKKLEPYLNTAKPDTAPAEQILHRNLGSFSIRSSGKRLTHNYRTLCSVGRAKEILYQHIQQMLRTQQDEIGFRYIKFHGLFDDQLMVYRENRNGTPLLNFTMLDTILDFLLKIGLRPFVQFSFMPQALAAEPDRTFFYNPLIISEAKDPGKWAYLIDQFLRHCIDRYGRTEVHQWIFTFWNETMNDFLFHFPTPEISLEMYQTTYHALKKVSPNLRWAGMSYAGSKLPDPNMDLFMDYARSHGCLPDLYLFHFYAVGPFAAEQDDSFRHMLHTGIHDPGRKLVLLENPDALTEFIDSMYTSYPEINQADIHLGEWNFTSSHRELLNDTIFPACYTVRNLLLNYDRLSSFCHWCLSDWIEELSLAGELFHGGMGFFTANGIRKPIYYAYCLLTKLEDQCIAAGEGYFITRSQDHERCCVVLYNYAHFSRLYGDGLNLQNTPTQRYHTFAHCAPQKYSFSIDDLIPGRYRLREHILNRSWGSAFDKWVEMGAGPLTAKEEIQTLDYLSRPMLRTKEMELPDGMWHYEDKLEMLEVRVVQMQKK